MAIIYEAPIPVSENTPPSWGRVAYMGDHRLQNVTYSVGRSTSPDQFGQVCLRWIDPQTGLDHEVTIPSPLVQEMARMIEHPGARAVFR